MEAFSGAEIHVYAISDVEGDSISNHRFGHWGLSPCKGDGRGRRSLPRTRLRANMPWAKATELELTVRQNEETLYGDVFELALAIGNRLRDVCRTRRLYMGW